MFSLEYAFHKRRHLTPQKNVIWGKFDLPQIYPLNGVKKLPQRWGKKKNLPQGVKKVKILKNPFSYLFYPGVRKYIIYPKNGTTVLITEMYRLCIAIKHMIRNLDISVARNRWCGKF